MCFRPPQATKPVKCPKCNTLNAPVLKVCRKCGASLENENKEKEESNNS